MSNNVITNYEETPDIKFESKLNLHDMSKEDRLKYYHARNAHFGLHDGLLTLKSEPKITIAENGAKIIRFNVQRYETATNISDYITASLYLRPDKVGTSYDKFASNLHKDDRLSAVYKIKEFQHKPHAELYNIYKMN